MTLEGHALDWWVGALGVVGSPLEDDFLPLTALMNEDWERAGPLRIEKAVLMFATI